MINETSLYILHILNNIKMLWTGLWQFIRIFRWNGQIIRNTKVPNLDKLKKTTRKMQLRKKSEEFCKI